MTGRRTPARPSRTRMSKIEAPSVAFHHRRHCDCRKSEADGRRLHRPPPGHGSWIGCGCDEYWPARAAAVGIGCAVPILDAAVDVQHASHSSTPCRPLRRRRSPSRSVATCPDTSR